MTPAPTLKPVHEQLSEARAYLDHRLRYGPDEDESQLSWSRSIKFQVDEIEQMKELIEGEDYECPGCKELFTQSEMEDGMCSQCWMKLAAAEAREER